MVTVLIDNGLHITIMNDATCKRLGLATSHLARTQPVHVASGEHIYDCTRFCEAVLDFSDKLTIATTCLVISVAADVISGNGWLRNPDATIYCKQDILAFTQNCQSRNIQGLKTRTATIDTTPMTIAMLESALENEDIAEYGLIKHDWYSSGPIQIAAMTTAQESMLSDLRAQYAMVLEKPLEGRPPEGPRWRFTFRAARHRFPTLHTDFRTPS
ncbi:hypothetical protein H4R24_000916 [Coemansia sp. RSA 988]|nr:hypothetical protein H4R24_000916 [Coemansia sp. RSA 988]